MSVGGWQMVLVPQAASSQCPVQPCPYCAVALPHNATSDDVLARCKQMTTETNKELNTIVASYTFRCGAARHILRLHDTAKKLPAAPSMFDLVGPALCRDYSYHMAPLIDPLGHMPLPPPFGAHPMSPAAAAGPQPSTGSRGTPTSMGDSRFLGDDEFPRWEFRGGKPKKLKWMPFYREPCELLEAAFELHLEHVTISIDDWQYDINLVNKTQRSLATGTVRDVRRLTSPRFS